MSKSKFHETQTSISIDTTGMCPSQIRLLKSLTTLACHVMTTEDESEYFDGSAEVMRMLAQSIKTANFSTELESNGIPYAEQALEFSLDNISENINGNNIINHDN